jgi:hypothetical protein
VVKEAAAILESQGIATGDRYAVFQVACHWGCYEWGSDKWAELADRLVEKHGLKVVITGTNEPFELAKFNEIRLLMRHTPVSLLGRTSIPHLFEVVRRAAIVVGSDSALTQVALAQRTPSVVMFGIEPMEHNGPLPQEVGTLLRPIQHWEGPLASPPPNAHCRFGESSCHTNCCSENASLRRTSVTEVEQEVATMLGRAGRSGIDSGLGALPAL